MAYELLVLDVDGTLVTTDKRITEKTRQALIECQENGVRVAIASGRCTEGIRHQAREIGLDQFGGYIISYNGGRITNFRTGEVIYDIPLPDGMIHELYDYSKKENTGILTYHDGKIIAHSDTDDYIVIDSKGCDLPIWVPEDFHREVTFSVNKCILTGEPAHLEQLEKKAAKDFEGRLSVYRSENFYLEMMPLGVDKAYGISKLLQHLGYSRSQTICCGDGFNDLSMVEFAGLGVAMANAGDELKERADYIAPSCDEDGLVDVIQRFVKDW
jgi:hypothetical protein